MRILFVSDSLTVPGAYAIQGRYYAKWLQAQGHEVLYFGTTYYGAQILYDGLPMVGGAVRGDLAGDGLINYYAHQHQADVVITFKDVYIYQPETLRALSVPWVPIVPIDTEPANVTTLQRLRYAAQVIAVTKNGQQMLLAEKVPALLAPHVIDTEFWCPGDKVTARQRLGLPADQFVAAFVGQNNSKPSRKNLDQIVLAWHEFVSTREDQRGAVLYLHTSVGTTYGGLDLDRLLYSIQLPHANYRITDPAQYDTGSIPAEFVRDVYRAADVLINPSAGGGFEVCTLEAQACGCPVIGCDFTGMRDTVGVGWRIGPSATTGETYWSELGGFRFRPTRAAIVATLDRAADARNEDGLSEKARDFAQRFSPKAVFEPYWAPAFQSIEDLLTHGRL